MKYNPVPIVATILISMMVAGCLGGNPIIPPEDEERDEFSITPFFEDWVTNNLHWTNSTRGYGSNYSAWAFKHFPSLVSTIDIELYRETWQLSLIIGYSDINETAFEEISWFDMDDFATSGNYIHIKTNDDDAYTPGIGYEFENVANKLEILQSYEGTTTSTKIEIPDHNNVIIKILGNTMFINGVTVPLIETYVESSILLYSDSPDSYTPTEETPYIEWAEVV